jgi:uncharacterized membrane protein YfhO
MKTKSLKIPWEHLFIILVPLILFAQFLAGKAYIYWGTPFFQFYPWREFALNSIRAGQIPLWNPYVGNGAPLIANYQSAIFYPINWLSLILPLDYSFSWIIFIHLVLSGFGMAMFMRGLGAKPIGQVVAGLAFGSSQYLVARAGFLSINAALAWLPWILWSIDRLLLSEKKDSIKYGLLLTLFAALQLLAGHAQTTWYTYLLLAAWTLYRLLTRQADRSRLIFLAAIFIVSASIAAVQLLPTAEYLQQSQRSTEYGYDAAVEYSYSPSRLLTLILPDLYGNPARQIYTGDTNYWEDADYIGLLPLLLTLGYLFSRIKSFRTDSTSTLPTFPNSMILFLIIIIVVSFMLALGKNAPIFPFFYQHIPTFNMFQAPTRMMIWFELSLAVLAGMAASEWIHPRHWAWQFLTLLFISADLIYANYGLNPAAPRSLYAAPSEPPSTSHRIYDARQFKYEYYLNFNLFGPPELSSEARSLHIANTNMLDGYSVVDNYDSLIEARYAKLTSALWNGVSDKVLQLMDVSQILIGANGADIHLEPTVLPPSRVWAATSAMLAADSETALTAVLANDFDPSQTVVLEQSDLIGVNLNSFLGKPKKQPASAQITSDTPNDVKITASLPKIGWVVLSDTYYPGWHVFVDGQPAKILHADYAFRAVIVPAGMHQIEFRYEPLSFKIGWIITALGLWVYIIACILYFTIRKMNAP